MSRRTTLRQRFAVSLAAAALCVAGEARARAQAASDSTGESHLAIAASVTTTYDTDVPRSDAETAHLRGLQLADEIEQPDVNVDLLKAIGQQSLFLRGDAGYNFYDRNSILDSEHVDLTGGADLRAAACQSTLSDHYARSENNLDDGIDVLIVKNLLTVDTVAMSLGCNRTIGFTPTGSISSSWSSNSSPLLAGTAYHSLSGQVGVAYRHPLLGYLSAYGTYGTTDYSGHGSQTVPIANAGYDQYGAGVHYDRNIGIKLTGSVDLSYVAVEQNGFGGHGYSGVSYGADLHAHITSRLSGTLHASRSVQPSPQLLSSFQIADSYSLSLGYLLSQHVNLSFGASQNVSNSQAIGSTPGLIVPHNTISDIYGQGSFDFARRFSLTLDVRGENATSNLSGLEYTSARISLTLKGKL